MADDQRRRSASSSSEDVKAWWLSLPNEPSIKSTKSTKPKDSGVLNADAGSAARVGGESQQQSFFEAQESKVKVYSSTRRGLSIVFACFCVLMLAAYLSGRLGLWNGASVTHSDWGEAARSFMSNTKRDSRTTGNSHMAYNAMRAAARPAARALAELGARHRREAVKFSWYVNYGMFIDDAVLTNESGIALNGVVFDVYIDNNGARSLLKTLNVGHIAAGKTYTWVNAFSVSQGTSLYAVLRCNELR